MTADEYLRSLLAREAVDTGPNSPVRGVRDSVMPMLTHWSDGFLNSVQPSGSFAKGTANRCGTDIDLFISLNPNVPGTLKDIFKSLGQRLTHEGYEPRKQNVSWNINVDGHKVDLVPARQQDVGSADHSLYRARKDNWTKTNVDLHIATVRNAGRSGEMRLVKLWRDQHDLDFPSLYVELSVIRALGVTTPAGAGKGSWTENMHTVFRYLRDNIENARIEDPANTSNVISDDVSGSDKAKIKVAAQNALAAGFWSKVIR